MNYLSFRRSTARLVAGAALLTGTLLVQGCLQREVKEQQPNTSNVFVEQIVNSAVNEIDLLFVVDNSVSMGDKQEILRKAVPAMVERLITPNCVGPEDDQGNRPVVGQSVLQPPDSDGNPQPPTCANGELEFTPVNDIHLGVITSSLGGHGSNACPRVTPEGSPPRNNDDQGRLVPTMRSGVNTGVDGLGFLAWAGGDETVRDTLIADFEEHVAATGEIGCGYEATLESWYRFLVDPNPPAQIVLDGERRSMMATDENGVGIVDDQVLAQRAAFLRPESLVAIIVLSDENDCSVMDGGVYYGNAGVGWLLTTRSDITSSEQGLPEYFQMPVATPICAENPNDKCCLSCLQSSNPPSGCGDQLSVCESTTTPKVAAQVDRGDENNVRCFDNKRRFGVNLLYPTQRYVDALTKPQIVDARTGTEVANPLLVGSGGLVRDPGLVFFAGIVGVPWQDVATPDTLNDANRLSLLTAAQLSEPVEGQGYNRWEVILGKPGLPAGSRVCSERDDPSCGAAPSAPIDPFMIESILPREVGLQNPITGDAIVAATSTDPTATINGHEVDHSIPDTFLGVGMDDLQYACIFPLADPLDAEECAASASCDCQGEPSRNSPLCQPPGGGPAEPAQYWGKAYPGTRILRVLKDFGNNSIVGSICPKFIDETSTDFGYNPAVQAIVDRLAEKLVGACLPRELTVDENGGVPCFVVEAKNPNDLNNPSLNCGSAGRAEVSQDIRDSVEKQLEDTNRCGGNSGVECSAYEMCTLVEHTPPTADDSGDVAAAKEAAREDCLFNEAPADTLPAAGFCYIDPAKGPSAGGISESGSTCTAEDTRGCTNPIVANCPATEKRLLRFVGPATPAAGAITFVACTGDAAGSDDPIPALPSGSGSSPSPSMGGSGG